MSETSCIAKALLTTDNDDTMMTIPDDGDGAGSINNGGNKDRPPRPNRYGDDDSDILGPDYCAFCDAEPCTWLQFGADILEYDTGFITSK
jgi:hypothetical protein